MWISAAATVAVVGAWAGLNTWVYRDFKAPILEPMEPIPALGSLSAATCSACHSQIYAEWKKSGHARAFLDPLYQAELRHQPAPFVCHRCHTPLVEQRKELATWMWAVLPKVVPKTEDNPRFDPLLQQEGVTCVACHQVQGRMVGPFDDAEGAPHPTAKGTLRAVDSCAVCHQFGFDRIGKLHRPIIDTVTEWHDYREDGGDKRCADCHLPVVPDRVAGQVGPTPGRLRPGTDHSLRGPFDAEFVATGLIVESPSIVVDEGVQGSVQLFNDTGHRLPTAEPERFVEVRLTAWDAQGNALTHVATRLERPVDVVKLRELGEDTTMHVHERRTIELSLDAVPPGAVEFSLTVDFWLWNPEHQAAAMAGFLSEDLVHHITDHRVTVAAGPP